MRERIGQAKKASTGSSSIPSLKQSTRGFGLNSSSDSPQTTTEVQAQNKPPTHDISRIPVLRPQAKLSISQPGDKFEEEADSVARQVMQRIAQPVNPQSIQREALPESEDELQMKTLNNSRLQRQSAPKDEEELQMKPMVQRRAKALMADAPDLEASINQARGGGQPMADNIREPMEQALGADFSGVKVHTDGQSDQLNQSIQARAFTTGQNVFFRQGAYQPGSREGQELIAHELTHVVQQNGGQTAQLLGGKVQRQIIQRRPDEETGGGEVGIPSVAQEIINKFNTGGLLIRTMQKQHAEKEFDHLEATVEEALEMAKRGNHSGLRKWSLTHKDLLPNYFKMGPEVTTMARYMAVLVDPSQVGDSYIGFHEKDAFSGNLQPDTKLVEQDKAISEIEDLLKKLKQNQEKSANALENNEVQTLGFSANSVAGLMYKAGGGMSGPKQWSAAKSDFQRLVNTMGKKLNQQTFQVFTYEIEGKQTKLVYLDTLSAKMD
ncbi:DUF4157 domain-containing protein [Nostoc sp. UHCC 0302]|uniref:eCIS core domain-containing protein n=1 Tax=Nostoc sp. UHCC 0302 TaxID=3134896 RepID=UPI00311C97E9